MSFISVLSPHFKNYIIQSQKKMVKQLSEIWYDVDGAENTSHSFVQN